MRFSRRFAIALLAAAAALASLPALAVDGQTMIITGEDYTKWLWGNQHTDGSVYNFTTVPGEGYGDNGQGTEIDLLIAPSPQERRGHGPPAVALQPEPVDQLRRLRRQRRRRPASAATAASSIRGRTSTSRCAA